MKTISKISMLLVLSSLATQSNAQETTAETTSRFSTKNFRTWSVGIHGGVLTPYTVFRGQTNDFNTPKENWGYGGYLKKQIIPSFGIQADFLAGNVEGLRASSLVPNTSANTLYEGSSFKSHIEWSAALTANFTLANLSINNEQGYFSPYVKAGAGYLSSNAEVVNAGPNRGYAENWFVPVGAGFKIGIAKGVNLDLGYDVNFMKTNTFDGVAGSRFDNFSYGHAGVEFALGKKENPQLANYSALADLRKQTAAESEELRRALSNAEQNALRDREQYAKDLGDDDGDGVANKFDKCANTPANTVVDGAGCPLTTPKQIIREKIMVTEVDRKIVDEAIKNLEFDLGKSTIRSVSYPTLNKVAALLVEKNFSLKLAGHTDNTGSMELNLRLSKERAEAVKAYLVSQGVNASRIEATGYGPNQPIASNATAAGRQENRRVEFTLF
ncbi:OmpA family protein [Pedobacter glucosidilyticus]|uniref:OmpA family protein n=1 Tax=Pedobacter glucosidilyticus TaxID=1122941 RepID=UPI0026F29F4F|nr:OmpA family protein [Pedobacter glucosidilyticus]